MHGATEDENGDVLFNRDSWKSTYESRDLKFVEYENEFILQDELIDYKKLKNSCIDKVLEIFNFWDVEVDICKEGDVVKTIVSNDEISYYVRFDYNTVQWMKTFLLDGTLNDVIREKVQIGLF